MKINRLLRIFLLAIVLVSCNRDNYNEKGLSHSPETEDESSLVSCKEENRNYNVIVAFCDEKNVSEDWNWFFSDISEIGKKNEIQVIHSLKKENKIEITTKNGDVVILDISEILKKHDMGYIFASQNKKMQCQEYEMVNTTMKAATKYFGISLLPE